MRVAMRAEGGFSLFELAVVIVVIALVIYAVVPHFEKTLKAANATAVSLNGRALLDGVRAAKMMRDVQAIPSTTYHGAIYDLPRFADGRVDVSAQGFPMGTGRHAGDRFSAKHCAEIWHAVTEPNPEQQGAVAENSFDAELMGLGGNTVCRYSYRRDPSMFITYDPNRGEVKVYAE
jgi:hypothetical protein